MRVKIIFLSLEIPKNIPQEEKDYIQQELESLKKICEEFATFTSNLFARFRVIFYSSVIKKMLVDLTEKRTPPTLILRLNKDNNLYIVPAVDRIILIYGINFSQTTDNSLARVILQELEESKRHVRNTIETKYFPDYSRPPADLKDLEPNPKNFSNGFVTFSILFFTNRSLC